jgi:hypothetical protein
MLWKGLGFVSLVCSAFVSAASATEFALEFDQQPVFALEGPGGSDLRLARYVVGGIEVELTALGSGFGYVDTTALPPGDDVSAGVIVNGQMECGNQPGCEPFVMNFSVELDAVAVDFLGVGDFSGSNGNIFESTFFLLAFSGPDGTGTLIRSSEHPGGPPGAPRSGGGFELPATLAAVAPTIRSIVFGSRTLSDGDGSLGTVNLAILDRVRMTVPEPSTLMLVALGLLGVARARRRGGRATGRAGEIRTLDLQTPSLAR